MNCDHDWAYDRRVPDGDTLLTIYKCKRCQTEAMGERYPNQTKRGEEKEIEGER